MSQQDFENPQLKSAAASIWPASEAKVSNTLMRNAGLLKKKKNSVMVKAMCHTDKCLIFCFREFNQMLAEFLLVCNEDFR